MVYLLQDIDISFYQKKKDIDISHIAMQNMSAEVVDSNPYSRLMALQRMGIVANYERIRDFSIAIVVCI